SRWFNHAAVRVAGAQLALLASQSFVQRVTPVDLAMPRARTPLPLEDVEPAEPAAPLAPGRGARSAAAQALYGQTFTQLQRLNVIAVHDSGYIGTGINICVLDDGFNWYRKHQTLRTIPVGAGRTRDFIRGDTSVQDTVDFPLDFQHGTTTLSTVAGRWSGVYLSPAYGCNVALARTENSASEKPIEMVYWAMGAEWADSLGCDIISSSLGYNLFPDSAGTDITYPMLDGHTTIITRAAQIAAAKGILVVTSAGNDGNNARVGRKISAPADANGDSTLAIGAIDSLGVRAGFSSKGPTFDGRIKPDLVAQGVAVLMVDPLTGNPNVYKRANGTSYSAPLLAGMAACLMQARPSWPPVLIVETLKRTASRAASPDTLVGWGVPDGLAALRYVPDTLHVPELNAPLSLRLAGPNPLRAGGSTRVRLELGAQQPGTRYRLRVLDAAGRVVRDLGQGVITPGGVLQLPWRGDDPQGRPLTPGLYFLALDTDGRTQSARVVVLR
ncbi:MAG: S8 family serine peptidase, partial [Candidatus Eisenbacteria bacterium]|nr:S8 family serine peptidase [Candidatus Eisenbacteria bacterium]